MHCFSIIALWWGINMSFRRRGRTGILIDHGNGKDETGLRSLFSVPIVTKFSALWKMNKIDVEGAAVDVCWRYCGFADVAISSFSVRGTLFNSISVLLTKASVITPLDIFTVNRVALYFLNAGDALVNGSDLAWPFWLFSFSINACDCRILSPQPTLKHPFSFCCKLSSLMALMQNNSTAVSPSTVTHRLTTVLKTRLTNGNITLYYDLPGQRGRFSAGELLVEAVLYLLQTWVKNKNNFSLPVLNVSPCTPPHWI